MSEGLPIFPQWSEATLHDWACALGTPCFIYTRRDLRHALGRYRSAVGMETTIRYALKSCYVPELLAAMRDEGKVGAEAMTQSEVAYAFDQGWPADDVDFNGVGRDGEIFRWAMERGIRCVLSSPREVEAFAGAGNASVSSQQRAGLRLWVRGMQQKYRRFGLSIAEAQRAVRRLGTGGVAVDQLTTHAWRGDLSHEAFAQAIEPVICFGERFLPRGWRCNIGGGDLPLRGPEFSQHLAELRHASRSSLAWGVEPGAALSNPAGFVLTRVVDLRRGHAVLDVPGAWLPPLKRAQYAAAALPYRPGGKPLHLADRLLAYPHLSPRRFDLGALGVGDLVMIYNCGAYTQTFAAPLGKEPPAVFWVDDQRPHPSQLTRCFASV